MKAGSLIGRKITKFLTKYFQISAIQILVKMEEPVERKTGHANATLIGPENIAKPVQVRKIVFSRLIDK